MHSRFFSYLNTSVVLLEQYQGGLPFHHHLKQFFRDHPKYGSRDRKTIAQICYAAFRTGHAFHSADPRHRILASLFLGPEEQAKECSGLFPDAWKDHLSLPLREKINFLHGQGLPFHPAALFPIPERISSLIVDKDDFFLAHLQQPRLFIRLRPGYEEQVQEKLHKSGILFNVNGSSIEMANGTKLEDILSIDREVVVQDLSSQRTGVMIAEALHAAGTNPKVWDCCAASGGKSILTYDIQPNISLTVSDNRESILSNLAERFQRAGIIQYQSFCLDMTRTEASPGMFDLVMADVPCSGSGTWGRSPESLFFFDSGMLDLYTDRQKRIINQAVASVRPGGQFLYITCSVFAAENEEMVAYIESNHPLTLRKSSLFEGWRSHADTLFVAWFTRS